jgi:hypothetical protein
MTARRKSFSDSADLPIHFFFHRAAVLFISAKHVVNQKNVLIDWTHWYQCGIFRWEVRSHSKRLPLSRSNLQARRVFFFTCPSLLEIIRHICRKRSTNHCSQWSSECVTKKKKKKKKQRKNTEMNNYINYFRNKSTTSLEHNLSSETHVRPARQ